MSRPVYIYAFVNPDRRVLYVGQTLTPQVRELLHRGGARKGQLKDATMRVLRKTNFQNANRIEWQIMTAYRKRGECLLNHRLFRPKSVKRLYGVRKVLWVEKCRTFQNITSAAKRLKLSTTTVGKAVRHNGAWYPGMTLKWL